MNCWRALLLSLFPVLLPACGQGDRDVRQPAGERVVASTPQSPSTDSDLIAALIDPAKLATLGDRGANPRVRKVTGILWQAKQAGRDPRNVAEAAIRKIGWGNTAKGVLTVDAMLRNLDILEKLGSTTPEDIALLARGKAPTVRKGPYAGDILSVDHIIPRSVQPELDNVIANLELMPLRMNQGKGDNVGQRQVDLGRKLKAAGLLE